MNLKDKEFLVKLKHEVLVKHGDANIGLFEKTAELPCLPPIGSEVIFGSGIRTTRTQVEGISYSEQHELFSVFYTIDCKAQMARIGDHIDEHFYPKQLVKHAGFSISWLEDN